MRAIEFTETRCPRTRAKECSCSKVKSITEAKDTTIAQCILEHSDSVKGSILLIQAPGTPTLIKGTITGLAPGKHGFHIHEYGDMSDGCKSMGGHYNPDGVDHGDLKKGHIGDLENITADENGIAEFSIVAPRVDLIGERSVIGRGIVVHEDEDDLGKGGDAESLKTGNAGERLACGVIVTRSEEVTEAHGGKHSTTGRSMTKGEKNKREKIVKGMKKDKAGFKKRYGKDAEAVMYATATKQAMK
jgi:Cu-Zn family superoxide dismutase